MIFLGRIFSWLMVVSGFLRAALGLYFAISLSGENQTIAAKRYLASATTGEAIDQGLILLVAGIALGLLTIIANNTSQN